MFRPVLAFEFEPNDNMGFLILGLATATSLQRGCRRAAGLLQKKLQNTPVHKPLI
jgi:hypothetical protein